MKLKKDNKIGRNMPCPCGSNKKYKKCCLLKIRRQEELKREAKFMNAPSQSSLSLER